MAELCKRAKGETMHFAPLPYLDPGSGSFLLQLAAAAILGGLVALRSYWGKIKGWFGIKSKPAEDDDESENE
jgi:hypothetical protein